MTTAVGSATETAVCEETTNGLYSEGSSRITDEAEDRLRELRTHLENMPHATRNWNASHNHTAPKRKPMKASVAGEAGVTCGWGGSDGFKTSVYAEGSIKDDRGYYGKVEVEQDFSTNKGSGSIVTGCEKEIDKTPSEKPK